MPTDALPQPWPAPAPGAVPLQRIYRDAIGAPMAGSVTIASLDRVAVGDVVMPPTTATVELVGGVLTAQLRPGRYRLVATLKGAGRGTITDTADVTVS